MMKNFYNNNGRDSSIFQGKIREEDLIASQKLDELKRATEELIKKAALETEKCERQASGYIDETLSQVKLAAGKDEDYFTDRIDSLLKELYNFFEHLFNEFEIDADPKKIHEMMKEKKEKSWILSIIKFLHNKLKELVKKIFSRDLSLDERLAKKIKELQKKLAGGELSEEEFARMLERLEALQNLKLKLQMFLVGWCITMFAEIFAVDLAASVEASEEEDKKAEKTSSKEKEASKEVVEIKVDKREKPQLTYGVIPVLDTGIWSGRFSLKPEELDLLPSSLKNILPPVRESGIGKDSENLQKPKEEKPKVVICPRVPAATNRTGQERKKVYGCNNRWKSNRGLGSSQPAQKPIFDGKVSDQPIPESVPNKGTLWQFIKSSVADCGFDFTNMGTWNGVKHEPQQSSVGGAQPISECSNVKVNNHVDSIGKAPLRE